tara:strand:- start:10535 stop:14677 length:4143 start_codon:yes stop_codon:yes gene_type:complete
MASVSQTIDNYNLGISKQPDHRLIPGQLRDIRNCTPDLTEGLPKRSGSKRIGRDPLANVQTNGTFFSYYRDENEGSYLGQVDSVDGKVRMWCTQDIKNSSGTKIHDAGDEIFVHYDTVSGAYTQSNYSSSNALHTNITSYLTPSSATAIEDIQALTINDTTFIANRTKVVSTGSTGNGSYTRNKSHTVATSAINTSTDVITVTNHGFSTGDRVFYIEAGSGLATPLANGTAYYVIKIDANTLKLATSATNATAGTAINITATGNNSQYLEYGFGIITVTKANHGLTATEAVDITFTADNAGAKPADGAYNITSIVDANTFTLTDTTITGMGLIDDPTDPACSYSAVTRLAPHKYYAFIDLLRTENGRQYSLNINNDDTSTADVTIKVATRVKIASTTQSTAGGTGHCPGIGTQVFSVTAADSYSGTNIVSVKNASGTDITSGRENLIFRITALGQQGSNPSGNFDDANISANEYICAYNNNVDLLHGGEGWEVGDKVVVTLDQAVTNYNFEIQIEKVETAVVKANIKDVRPEPTPFDAETAVTVDTILGGITTELDTVSSSHDLNYDIIGNGIYLWSSNPFNIQVPDKDLIRVMQSDVNNVAELPNQCKHDYIVKVTNSRDADEDDYYLKFIGENNRNGPGSWQECPKPGIISSLNADTMPHVLQRQPIDSNNKVIFLLKAYDWGKRDVGDDTTNPMPTFADGSSKINKVLFFRNRLAFLSGENVILSRPGDLVTPSFFAKTALAVSAIDPIDISSSSTYPSDLFDGIEIPAGLVIFSTNQQFLLATDAEVLNPDTAKFQSISHYSYDKNISPISLGTTIGYIDNTGGSCRFMEMQQVQREQEPVVVESSKVVQNMMPNTINHVINSPENGLVFFHNQGAVGYQGTTFYGFKYQDYGERKQAAWFKWEFDLGNDTTNGSIRYSFIIDDAFYLLSSDGFLVRCNLVKGTDANDPHSIVFDLNVISPLKDSYLYLDNWVTMTGGVYDSTTGKTTFTHGTGTADFAWHNSISGYSPTEQSEELFLQYTTAADPTSNSATWTDAGKIIPINSAKPAGLNNYSVNLNTNIQALGNIAFRLYQPYNTSAETSGHMDTYGIITLKYKKADGSTHSTLTMSDTNNHLAKSNAVGVKATASGSGSTGGFNTGTNYLWFSSEVDSNSQNERWVIMPKIDVVNNGITEVEIGAFVGNNSNGGEHPDVSGTSGLATDGFNNDGLFAIAFLDDNNYTLSQPVEDLVKGTSFKVSGDWSSATIYVGFHYGIYLDFPIFYYTQQQGESVKRDYQDYLVLHRLKINTSEASSCTSTISLTNSGYTATDHPSIKSNQYLSGRLDGVNHASLTVPIYQKNNNFKFSLSQNRIKNQVGPFNLQSISWEGDYSPKNYRRV